MERWPLVALSDDVAPRSGERYSAVAADRPNLLVSPAVNGFFHSVPRLANRSGSTGRKSNPGSRPVRRLATILPVIAAQEKPPPLKPAATVRPGCDDIRPISGRPSAV